ncbi:hypothetical protein GCM10028833_29320 [Glycomyces tarimensis]
MISEASGREVAATTPSVPQSPLKTISSPPEASGSSAIAIVTPAAPPSASIDAAESAARRDLRRWERRSAAAWTVGGTRPSRTGYGRGGRVSARRVDLRLARFAVGDSPSFVVCLPMPMNLQLRIRVRTELLINGNQVSTSFNERVADR